MRYLEFCKDDSFAGIRRWLPIFASHLAAHGFYIHPFWCYKKDHGGLWGFIYGEHEGADLPLRMEIQLRAQTRIIHRILSNKDMFPAESSYKAIVDACPGDGYHALKSILLHVHPAFQPEPATLIASYPYQRELSFLQYHQLFNDFLQLRAYIQNYDSSLDNSAELDVFINRSKHSTYLTQVTREARRNPANAAKYQGAQLPETLQAFLKALPPSEKSEKRRPTTPTTNDNFVPYHNKNRRSFPPTQTYTPIQQVSATDATQIIDNSTSGNESNLFDDVYTLDVPNDATNRKIFATYTAQINKIKTHPHDANERRCLLCDAPHVFKDCPVLNNTSFLQQHLIRTKQFLNQYDNALSKTMEAPVTPAPINYYGCLNQYDEDTDDDSSVTDFDANADFQQGRL